MVLTHFSSAMNEPEVYTDNVKSKFNNTVIGYDRYSTTLRFED